MNDNINENEQFTSRVFPTLLPVFNQEYWFKDYIKRSPESWEINMFFAEKY